jgi:hypothetical protein
MPLRGGDRLAGILSLEVIDQHGDVLIEGVFIDDMDIDADQNVVTMMVNSDINDGRRNEKLRKRRRAGVRKT